jgi:benzoyl-CoA reductase/2-hydroxyglutaryl-CoA dehydratase subunit BcrC/BadD/HgdB
MLEELLREVRGRRLPGAEDQHRILIYGSELDNPEYLQIIEDLGGIVVTDDLCMGSRYFRGEVKVDGDPLRALADRYLTKPLCPRMHPAPDRVKYLQQLARDFQVDGVIHQSLKFCDLHAGQFLVSKAGFDEIGVPVLNLEREYALSGHGQIRTRVSAFFEALEGRRIER